ncbi:MAG: signal peptidase I [Firmicutes bacterium]|nr:signal peptidase I [Bacillota bacterium]
MTQEKPPFWREILESVILAVVLAAVIRLWLFEPFYIPSPSMQPTLYPRDRIIVNKLSYRLHPPKRGDVVVFKFPLDPQRDFIKRIIGLEEETVEIRQGYVYINGRRLEEPYLSYEPVPNYGPVKVPRGYLFVMGDNRNNSEDSRFWGCLNKKYLVGKAFFIYWPPHRIGLIR